MEGNASHAGFGQGGLAKRGAAYEFPPDLRELFRPVGIERDEFCGKFFHCGSAEATDAECTGWRGDG